MNYWAILTKIEGNITAYDAVIADINMLKTLPRREFLAGMVEIIKYGLIKDVNFFEYLEVNYKEILEQLDVPIDGFCDSVGTAGSLMGVSRALKKPIKKPKLSY